VHEIIFQFGPTKVDENITIEEYLQICGQQIEEEFNFHVESEVKKLHEGLAVVEKELLRAHTSVLESNKKENKSLNNEGEYYNTNLEITVKGGAYDGFMYHIKPRARAPCFLGRSTSKKFRDKGISMPKDGEISTTHGKFDVKDDGVYYSDLGSTNGTLYENNDLEANKPLKLRDGLIIQVGEGKLTMKLVLV